MNHRPITSIFNLFIINVKRGLILLTHQLLSSPIFEYNTLDIMHNGCDRYVLYTSLLNNLKYHALLCQFSCCWLKEDTCSTRRKVYFANRTHIYPKPPKWDSMYCDKNCENCTCTTYTLLRV